MLYLKKPNSQSEPPASKIQFYNHSSQIKAISVAAAAILDFFFLFNCIYMLLNFFFFYHSYRGL